MRSASPKTIYGKDGGTGRAGLWLIGAAFGIAVLTAPGMVWAADAPSPAGIGLLLTSASNLTDGEMAAQTGSGLHLAAPVPNLQSLHPKVQLWDELMPTISAGGQMQSATVTVHSGP